MLLKSCLSLMSQCLQRTLHINNFVSWQSLPIKFQRSTIVTSKQMLLSTTLCFIALCSILQALTNQQLFQVVNCLHFTGAEPDPARLEIHPGPKKPIVI